MNFNITLKPLAIEDIDDQYCAWYENADGHLNYFTGSGRKFARETLIEDFKKGTVSGSWYYFLVEDAGSAVSNSRPPCKVAFCHGLGFEFS